VSVTVSMSMPVVPTPVVTVAGVARAWSMSEMASVIEGRASVSLVVSRRTRSTTESVRTVSHIISNVLTVLRDTDPVLGVKPAGLAAPDNAGGHLHLVLTVLDEVGGG